jgi:methylenetetrahydrofolate reductase (NADPH)
MPAEKTGLQKRIDSGEPILAAELSPPQGGDADAVREAARRFAGKVHALGVSDNRDGVRMSALAAASLVAGEGVEPILHVVTRDRNRIALVSDYLGAQALGIGNLLCTSGTHQTLTRARAAKNVFDLDSIQLLRTYANLAGDGRVVGEDGVQGRGATCLGGVAAPYADPPEMQLMRLRKKVAAGAKFLITQPAFDLGRFADWWKEVTRQGIHQQVAILAGIRVLSSAEEATAYAQGRPDPLVPDEVVRRMASKADSGQQRAAGIEVALATIEQLSRLGGLRGFSIYSAGDDDAAVEVIERSGLGGAA